MKEFQKMKEIEQECGVMKLYKTLIKANKNFTYEVVETVCKEEKLRPGKYVINCVKFNMTCHDNCCIPDDADKAGCWAIKSDGYCRICGCHWNYRMSKILAKF